MNLKDLRHRYRLSPGVISLIVMIHSVCVLLFDTLVSLLVRRGAEQGTRKQLLVIKCDAIGDFVIWLDFARGLRELYPADRFQITLLGNRAWTGFAKGTALFDEIMPVDRMRFILNLPYRAKVLALIKRRGFDVVVDPTYSREFYFSPAVARASGASERLAPEGDAGNQRPWQKRVSDGWYSTLLPSAHLQLMELQRNAEFLRGLGHASFRAAIPKLPLPGVTNPAQKPPYYVLFPGGSSANKFWPLRRFAALAARIFEETGMTGVICGGPAEKPLAQELLAAGESPLENRVAATTLEGLAGLIAGASFVVTNDTSAVHISAAVGTPAVSIVGGGNFGRFLPYAPEEDSAAPLPVAVYHEMECYGCNWNCIHPVQGRDPFPCIDGVTLEMVWLEVRKLLPRKE